MSTMEFKMPEDLMIKLSKLETDKGKIIEAVLHVGAKVAIGQVESNIRSKVGSGLKYPRTGTEELLGALGISPVEKDLKTGEPNIKIGFKEPRRKQYPAKKKRSYNEITNAMIANVIERGKKPETANQPKKEIFKPAERKIRDTAIKAMQEEFDRQVEKL